MFDAPFGRVHALSLRRDGRGVFCGEDGLFVGPIPLLREEPAIGGKRSWTPRALAAINRDLARCYGAPVDAMAKMGGIGAVARALTDADPARACIAAVHLRLPEIPDSSPQGLAKCATALAKTGLLKASPDDPKHPGWPAGTPGGKGGQFRPKEESESESVGGAESANQLGRRVLGRLGAHIVKSMIKHAMTGIAGSILGPEVPATEIAGAIVDLGLAAHDAAVEAAPYVKAYFDEPRTLDELQDAAKTREKGYDIHHIVERATAAPDGSEDAFINGPENLVSIPTVQRWDLNQWYESRNKSYDGLTPRQYLKDKSLEERFHLGLDGLREIGVLKP